MPRPAQRPPPPPNSAAAIAAAAVVLPMPISPRHNHGVTARGVSAYPAAVTAQMVANFSAGGAAINQLARAADAALRVVALALDVSMFHDERPGYFPCDSTIPFDPLTNFG